MEIITALGNETMANKIRDQCQDIIFNSDIQYQEAVIDVLEKNSKIDLLILSSIIPGELNIYEFINLIKYKNPNLEIIIILEKENNKLINFLVTKGINKIYYNNKNNINEIIQKINEINNKKIIDNKINKLEKIILEKSNNNLYKLIINKLKFIKNKNKIKIIEKNNKKNTKIFSIIGAPKSGKTIFLLILSKILKNKKILLINFNLNNNNIKIIIGIKKYSKKNQKNDVIKWKNNVDILDCAKEKTIENNQKGNDNLSNIISNARANYDYIFLDTGSIQNQHEIIKKCDEIILLVEPNLLGISETRKILEEVVLKHKIQKDKIKVVFNKVEITSINSKLLSIMFSDFKILGNIHYDKNYNILLNTNFKIFSPRIEKEYKNIIKYFLQN